MAKLPNSGSDNYEFDLVGTDKVPFLGYNSAHDPTTVSPQFMVRGSKNMYLKTSKTIANRPGLKQRGAADATLAGVLSSWEWNNSLGRCYPLRVANNKLQFESSIADGSNFVWYDLLLSDLTNPAATLTRFIMDTWYSSSEKKDRVVMVRGDANILHWSGGVTKVASGTATTLTKSDSSTTWNQDGFASQASGEKKIIVSLNGVKTEITYTGGENSATLTGVNIDCTSVDVGSIAIQSVLVQANGSGNSIGDTGFTNDICKVIGNQLYVASNKSRLVYISSATDFTNFTVPTPPLAGSPELLTLDNPVIGIGIRQGHAWITGGTKDWYEVTFSNITVGSTLTRQTNVDKKPTAELSAALAHEFIDNLGGDIVYLSQDQQIRDIGTFVGVLDGQKFPSLSLAVMGELAEEDFTGGHLRVIGDGRIGTTIYMTSPNSGRDYMLTITEELNEQGSITVNRIWHPPQVRNISRIAVIRGVIYGHSNSNPMIYQVWNTNQWHDDSPSGEALRYVCVLQFGYRSFGRRQGKWRFDKLLAIGYMKPGTTLDAYVNLDYKGATGMLNPNITGQNKVAKIFASASAPSLGDASLGSNPLGDGLNTASNDQELLAKFYRICNLTQKPCYEVGLQVYSQNPDDRWEIITIGFNPRVSSQQGVELQKLTG